VSTRNIIIILLSINALNKHLSSSSHNIQVLFGKTNEKSGDMQRTTNKVIVHPSFNAELGINDIALLRLSETVTFTGKIFYIYNASIIDLFLKMPFNLYTCKGQQRPHFQALRRLH
jgi:hypothetical protein